jgi:hypothetical protein
MEEANRQHGLRGQNVKMIDRLEPQWLEGNLFNPASVPTLVIRGLRGLGDNINQRAFLKELNFSFYLDTPWPELYGDLPNAKLIPCSTTLRTQNKNLARQPENRFVAAPTHDYSELRVQYGTRDLQKGSMYEALSRIFGGIRPKSWSLPQFPFPVDKIERQPKIAVIRPATVRKEWAAISRNPDPKYLKEASQILLEQGYYIVSIADLEDGHEWLLEPRPSAQLELHRGELNVEELIGLCRGADMLVGGHGFLTHIALAEKIPMFCVMGGFGGDNRPLTVADPEFMDVSPVTFAVPDNFCQCTVMSHTACNKTISGFEEKFIAWLEGLL